MVSISVKLQREQAIINRPCINSSQQHQHIKKLKPKQIRDKHSLLYCIYFIYSFSKNKKKNDKIKCNYNYIVVAVLFEVT